MKTVIVDAVNLHNPCFCGGTCFSYSSLTDFGTFKVVRCCSCGARRTYPEPHSSKLANLYSQNTEKYSLAIAEDPRRQYVWRTFSDGILDAVEGQRPRQRNGRLLEIGCNFGDLLFTARERGYLADGLEINGENAKWLRNKGFVVYDVPLEKAAIPDSAYDVIVMNQLLEHIPIISTFLENVSRVLKPGGVVFVGVPCFWGPIPLFLKRAKWYALLPNEHIWQFDKASLLACLGRHGLTSVWVERGCSDMAGSFSLRPRRFARWLIYKTVTWCRQGDFLNVIAKKA